MIDLKNIKPPKYELIVVHSLTPHIREGVWNLAEWERKLTTDLGYKYGAVQLFASRKTLLTVRAKTFP